MRSSTRLILTIAAGTCLGASARAQTPVHWNAVAVPVTASPGAKIGVVLTATIDSAWHIYSVTQPAGGPVRTEVTVPTGQSFSLSASIVAKKPDVKFDENFQMNVEQYEGVAEIRVPVTVGRTAPLGKRIIRIAVRYQACNARVCLPAKTDTLDARVTVAAPK
jgi:DsbC/DsbD-like thiol-disulfide interchange protein